MKRLLSAAVVVVAMLGVLAPVLHVMSAHAATDTTVVLTFDDGVASQSIAKTLLDSHGMKGTFYVNSPAIGTPGYLTWAQLAQFQSSGSEIGGHTLDHPDLMTLTFEQVQAQVCNDRANIASHGLTVTNFAYPYGTGYSTPLVRGLVQGCGYNSARRAWGLYSSAPECTGTGCGYPYAETIPPADPYAVAAGDNPQTTTTLAQIQALVTQAETHGGGLVPIVFHQICDACDPYSTTQATFQAFLDWLQPRAASGTVVKTMAQVIGGTVQPIDATAPTSAIKCDGAACAGGWFRPTTQVSLSATDNAGGSGVAAIRYTTDGSTPSTSSPAYTVPFTLPSTQTVKYRAWDNAGNAETTKSQLVQIDAIAPTSAITCNGAACAAYGYSAPAQVTLSGSDTGGSGFAAVRYTLDGSDPTAASTLYSAPFTVSSTQTVKFRAFDNAGNAGTTNTQVVLFDTDAPVSTIACNGAVCSDGFYGAAVQVAISATDIGSGVAAIHYTLDGSDPTAASTLYSAPFTVPSTQTVKYRASDNAGNTEPTKTQAIQIDTAAPGVSVTCQRTACSSGWYRAPVQVALTATDNGGSGVAAIYYTTDGSTPTLTSPTYRGPFTLSASRNVRFRAVDNAGIIGAVKTTLVKIDSTAPTFAVNSPGVTSFVAGSVKISVKANDKQSHVARVYYYVDRKLVATDRRAPFAFTFKTGALAKGKHTLSAKAVDIAGNSRFKVISVTVS